MITEGQLRVIPGAKVSISGLKKQAAPADKTQMSGRRRVKHAQDTEG